jgi:hypothetical protein
VIKDAAAELAREPVLGSDTDGKRANSLFVSEKRRVIGRTEKRRQGNFRGWFRPEWTAAGIHAGLSKSN